MVSDKKFIENFLEASWGQYNALLNLCCLEQGMLDPQIEFDFQNAHNQTVNRHATIIQAIIFP
jgi:hypothetical protein